MRYETYICTMWMLKHAAQYIRKQRGTGNCADAIVRNRTLKTLTDAEFALVCEYAKQFEVPYESVS